MRTLSSSRRNCRLEDLDRQASGRTILRQKFSHGPPYRPSNTLTEHLDPGSSQEGWWGRLCVYFSCILAHAGRHRLHQEHMQVSPKLCTLWAHQRHYWIKHSPSVALRVIFLFGALCTPFWTSWSNELSWNALICWLRIPADSWLDFGPYYVAIIVFKAAHKWHR